MGMLLERFQVPMLFVSVLCIFIATAVSFETQRVTLDVQDSLVVMDNGILQLTLSKPQGRIIAIKYNGIDNLLKLSRGGDNLGGYWDVVWNYPGSGHIGVLEILEGTEFKIIVETENQVEVSFKRYWNASLQNTAHLNTDIRYIMLRGVSGFYTYSIFEHEKSCPAIDISEARVAFKPNGDRFHYMVISDNKKKEMPAEIDRQQPRGEQLAYKEAVLLTDPIETELKGEVDDKYQYSLDHKNNRVHGWISDNPSTGFWIITPSYESKTGGPLKQDLTSHTGPTSLAVFIGDHYVGSDIHFSLQDGEYWKKTLGPVFIYLNSNSNQNHSGSARDHLWDNAKAQMQKEVDRWPYEFPASEEFLKSNQRGSVTGRLSIYDRYSNTSDKLADFPYVGLALPGKPGSWQAEYKGYQFWTRADANGYFTINNIIPGNYSLYAWVPGIVGDFMHNVAISITTGKILCSKIDLGALTFEHPRAGPTLWEIGVPDRSAAEFFIPDTNPKYVNKLYIKDEKYRQYGLWERYTDLYPKDDLVYKVGTSNYKKDWFYAHVTRKVGEEYYTTTWQIKFNLNNAQKNSSYMLRVAIATSHMSRLEVRVNDPNGKAHFRTNVFGGGNGITEDRHNSSWSKQHEHGWTKNVASDSVSVSFF
ncbi:putative rhamnogalacturonate lyase B isoform X1 [Carex littledalei]|uniref:rhamnogalacturonan endolyase n=1 Tax=Carex littledalei TaxID=544730 RepID=A0A833QYK9_9POAL|nr:putative rhamnogalacturonate lyase B isoform X1 [Carex littledalei]